MMITYVTDLHYIWSLCCAADGSYCLRTFPSDGTIVWLSTQNIGFQKVANSSCELASVDPISVQGLFVQYEYFILYSSICVAYIVLDMVANMEVNMVADMEVDMVFAS